MLNVEPVADDITTALRSRLPAAIDAVRVATDTRIPLAPPPGSSYYLGEYQRYRSYQLPACFVVFSRSALIYAGPEAGGNIDKWEHTALIDLLMEHGGPGAEEALTRTCFRMAEAAYAVLHDQDVTRNLGPYPPRSVKVFVESVDYGPLIARGDSGTFRKDIFLTCKVLHYDRETMAA